jgi:hypothetical protein
VNLRERISNTRLTLNSKSLKEKKKIMRIKNILE